jgi:hypothetical protein
VIELFQPYKDCEPVGVTLPKIKLSSSEIAAISQDLSTNSTSSEVLRALARKGLAQRKILDQPNKKEYLNRAKQEIETLEELGFVDYILLNWDVMGFCHKNNIIVGNGRGCFLPEQTVKLKNNKFKNIEDVLVGDIVIDHNKEEKRVLDTLSYDIKEEIIILQLENGVEIKCTKDHEFFTNNRGWVRAEDLTEEDDLREIT